MSGNDWVCRDLQSSCLYRDPFVPAELSIATFVGHRVFGKPEILAPVLGCSTYICIGHTYFHHTVSGHY